MASKKEKLELLEQKGAYELFSDFMELLEDEGHLPALEAEEVIPLLKDKYIRELRQEEEEANKNQQKLF